jgi:hypothetical protein
MLKSPVLDRVLPAQGWEFWQKFTTNPQSLPTVVGFFGVVG